MSKKLYEESNLQSIGSAIRHVNGGNDAYLPSEMPSAIRALKKTLVSKTISENGTYNPASDDADGYSAVQVAVQPDLELLSVTQNGNYTPSSGKDGFSSVAVNVQSGGTGILIQKTITENGVYIALDDDSADGYNEVIVNVTGSSGRCPRSESISFFYVVDTNAAMWWDSSVTASITE